MGYKLLETTKSLSITCTSICGRHGLRMFGRHFTAKATTVDLSDLKPGEAEKLIGNHSLIVEQLGAKTSPLPGVGEPAAEAKPKRKRKTKAKE